MDPNEVIIEIVADPSKHLTIRDLKRITDEIPAWAPVSLRGRRYNCAICFRQIPYDQPQIGVCSVSTAYPGKPYNIFRSRRYMTTLLLCTKCAVFRVDVNESLLERYAEAQHPKKKKEYVYTLDSGIKAGLVDLIKLYLKLEGQAYLYAPTYIKWGRKYLAQRKHR